MNLIKIVSVFGIATAVSGAHAASYNVNTNNQSSIGISSVLSDYTNYQFQSGQLSLNFYGEYNPQNSSSNTTQTYNNGYGAYNHYQSEQITNYRKDAIDTVSVSTAGGAIGSGSDGTNYYSTQYLTSDTGYYYTGQHTAATGTYSYRCGLFSTCYGTRYSYFNNYDRNITYTNDSGYKGQFTVILDLVEADLLSLQDLGTLAWSFFSTSGAVSFTSALLTFDATAIPALQPVSGQVPTPSTPALLVAGFIGFGFSFRKAGRGLIQFHQH